MDRQIEKNCGILEPNELFKYRKVIDGCREFDADIEIDLKMGQIGSCVSKTYTCK